MFKNRQFLRVLVLITVLIIGYVFSIGKDAIQIDRQGDAAIFEQVSENIYAGKGAISNVFAATQNYIDRQYFSYSLSELLAKKLEPPISKERNMTHFHAYWVLYLFAPLLAWFHSSLLLTASQVLVYLGLVYGAFYILEKECNRFPIALLFGILILISPAIAGGIAGQFYPDRLFVFLGFLLCYLVYYKANIIIIVLLSLLTALINERAALIGGLTIIFVPLCQRDSLIFIKRNVAVFVVGLVLIAYSYWVGKFWLSNLYYSTYLPKNLTELTARFSDPVFFHNAVIFVLSNAVLLAFSMGNYRLFFLSVFFMIPNFIGNIGGAEKVNWLTHYHSYYIPVLVFSAAEGAAVIGNKLSFGKNLGFITIAFFLTCGLLSHESDSGHALYRCFNVLRGGLFAYVPRVDLWLV